MTALRSPTHRTAPLARCLAAAALALAGGAAPAGCGPSARETTDGGAGGGDGGAGGGDGGQAAEQCQKMDLVFVVDDSASMSEEQQNLASNFPRFASLLDAYTLTSGQPLDYRVGVTTTGRDVTWNITVGSITIPNNEHGDNGALRNTCGVSRRWLERTDPGLATTFACRANVGTDGPTFEMPMLTTMMALKERLVDGTNAGFLRDDALLAIVIITDEDDCSRRDDNFSASNDHDGCAVMPQELVAFLDQLKGGRNRWAAEVISGDNSGGNGGCDSAFGSAMDAKRLQQFVALANSGTANHNAVFESICSGDLTMSLKRALDTFEQACNNFTIGRVAR